MKGGPKSSLRPFLHRALHIYFVLRKNGSHRSTRFCFYFLANMFQQFAFIRTSMKSIYIYKQFSELKMTLRQIFL